MALNQDLHFGSDLALLSGLEGYLKHVIAHLRWHFKPVEMNSQPGNKDKRRSSSRFDFYGSFQIYPLWLSGISRGQGVGSTNLLGVQREEPEQVRDSDVLSTPSPREPRFLRYNA